MVVRFSRLGEYRDSAAKAVKAENKKRTLKKKRFKRNLTITSIVATVATFVIVFITVVKPSMDYNSAKSELAAGNYDAAYSAFIALDDYKDAQTMAQESMYQKGTALLAEGKYDDASATFESVSGYNDAETLALESMYQKGSALLVAGKYDGAAAAFEAVTGYSNAETMALESIYQKGTTLLAAGKYDDASATFERIPDYNDAATMAKESIYQKGTTLLVAGEYDSAAAAFGNIMGYNDANTMAKESMYQKGTTLLAAGEYDNAKIAFESVSSYSDAATMAKECMYQKGTALLMASDYAGAYAIFAPIKGYGDVDNLLTNNENLAAIAAKLDATFTVGNYVTFGGYQQTASGNDDTPIEWLVLKRDGNKALIISRYGLEYMEYEDDFEPSSWMYCPLRKWLNEDFLQEAFSVYEQSAIVATTHKEGVNPKYEHPIGDDMQDKIFLLSITEAEELFDSDEARICKATDHAVSEVRYDLEYITDRWWLRTRGESWYKVAVVTDDGYIDYYGEKVDSGFFYDPLIMVRPALWVDLDSGVF